MSSQSDGGWTRDMITALRKMHDDGLSMSQIASQLNRQVWDGYDRRLTRSAVISKIHRLGWARGVRPRPAAPRVIDASAKPTEAKSVWQTPKLVPSKPAPKPKRQAVVPAVVVESDPVDIMGLTLCSCRWPVSGEGADMRYCGRSVNPKAHFRYCDAHLKTALSADGYRQHQQKLEGKTARKPRRQAQPVRRWA